MEKKQAIRTAFGVVGICFAVIAFFCLLFLLIFWAAGVYVNETSGSAKTTAEVSCARVFNDKGDVRYSGTYQDYKVFVTISKKCGGRHIVLRRPTRNHFLEVIAANDDAGTNNWTELYTENSFNGYGYPRMFVKIDETGMMHVCFWECSSGTFDNPSNPPLMEQIYAKIDLADKAFAAVHQPQYLTKE